MVGGVLVDGGSGCSLEGRAGAYGIYVRPTTGVGVFLGADINIRQKLLTCITPGLLHIHTRFIYLYSIRKTNKPQSTTSPIQPKSIPTPHRTEPIPYVQPTSQSRTQPPLLISHRPEATTIPKHTHLTPHTTITMGRGGYNGVASKVHARTGTACMPTIQVSFGRGGYNSTARSAVPDSPQASHEPSSPTITTPTARDNSWRRMSYDWA